LQQVKLLSYILAFYLILLSAVPCCAFDNCPDDKMDLSAGSEQAEKHENGDDDCGSCSPFFSCEGCATATVSFEPVQFEIVPTPLVSVYTGYIQTSLPQIGYDFWQPPKIG
jgi:hypothetical protein